MGAQNLEDYEDMIILKNKQIENNEIFLTETVKQYEEIINNLKVKKQKQLIK